jgi:hypothetical protein
MRTAVSTVAVVAALLLSAHAQAAEILVNGGFELGASGTIPPQGWTETSNPGWISSGGAPHSGLRGATSGAVGSESIISQTIATVAGQSYTFSGWFSLGAGGGRSGSLYWNGVQVANLLSSVGYQQLTVNVLGTGTDVAGVGLRDDPGFSSMDDISVQGRAVPEPTSLTLLGTGIAMLVGITAVRRKRA